MRTYLSMLLMLCLLTIGAAILLRPSAVVQYEAQLSRLHPEDALALLAAHGSYGPAERDIALLHARLALQSGDVAQADAGFRRLLDEMPNEPGLRDELARSARVQGDLRGAARWLAEAYQIAPSPARRDQLAVMYRLLRDPQAELALIETIPADALHPPDMDRRIQLLQALDRAPQIREMCTDLAQGAGPLASRARRCVLDYLIDEAQMDTALAQSMGWFVAAGHDPQVIDDVLPTLIGRGAIDTAYSFAVNAMAAAPDTAARIVPPFVRAGHRMAARSLQDAWLSQARSLRHEDWVALIEQAGVTGDLSGLRLALARFAPGDTAATDTAAALRQLLRYQGSRALLPFQDHLTPEVAAAGPLVAAGMALEMSRPEAARQALIVASHSDLDAWDRDVWVALAERLRDTPAWQMLQGGGIADPRLSAALAGRTNALMAAAAAAE